MRSLLVLFLMPIASAHAILETPDPGRSSHYLRLGIPPSAVQVLSADDLRKIRREAEYFADTPVERERLDEALDFFLRNPKDQASVQTQLEGLSGTELAALARMERRYQGSGKLHPAPQSEGALSGLAFYTEHVLEQMSPGWRENRELVELFAEKVWRGRTEILGKTGELIPSFRELLTIRYAQPDPATRERLWDYLHGRLYYDLEGKAPKLANQLELIRQLREEEALTQVMEELLTRRGSQSESLDAWRKTLADYLIHARYRPRQSKFEFVLAISRILTKDSLSLETRRRILSAFLDMETLRRKPEEDASFDRWLWSTLDCSSLIHRSNLTERPGRSEDLSGRGNVPLEGL